jgi:hypothetical protein
LSIGATPAKQKILGQFLMKQKLRSNKINQIFGNACPGTSWSGH